MQAIKEKDGIFLNNLAKIFSDLRPQTIAQIFALKSFLKTSEDKINTEEKELLELTLNSCNYVKNIIDMFILANASNEKNIFLNYEKFDFAELLNEILNNTKVLFKYYDLKLRINMPENLEIKADKRKIKNVVENLFLNVLYFSFKDSVVDIKLHKRNCEILFEIKNKCANINEENIENLFKDGSILKKDDISLKLISLYVIYRTINAHSGKLFIKNYENNSRIYGFSLPVNNQCAN